MPKNRAVQHKPKNEERKAKELVDLKQENHSLKRKLKRLQKEVRKLGPVNEEYEEHEGSGAGMPEIERCPKCQVPTKSLELAGKRYRICGECKWRQKA